MPSKGVNEEELQLVGLATELVGLATGWTCNWLGLQLVVVGLATGEEGKGQQAKEGTVVKKRHNEECISRDGHLVMTRLRLSPSPYTSIYMGRPEPIRVLPSLR